MPDLRKLVADGLEARGGGIGAGADLRKPTRSFHLAIVDWWREVAGRSSATSAPPRPKASKRARSGAAPTRTMPLWRVSATNSALACGEARMVVAWGVHVHMPMA